MKIIVGQNNLVLYSGENLSLTAEFAQVGKVKDPTTTTANAELIEVESLPAAVVGGKYTYTEAGGFVATSALLSLKKEELLDLLNTKEKVVETAGLTLTGGTFIRTDALTQLRLSQAASECRANAQMTFDWKMATGDFVTLDAPTILIMNAAVVARVQACLSRERALTESIVACETVAELENININTGWPE